VIELTHANTRKGFPMERDLRRFPRIASQHAVLVKRLGGSSEFEELASTVSVGLGGCAFLADEPLGVGSVVEVLLSVRHEVVRAKAKVVYETAEPNGKCEVGLAYVDLADADRVRIEQLFEKDE
jgi:hypothetical protein